MIFLYKISLKHYDEVSDDFMELVNTTFSLERDANYFKWKYVDNPSNPSEPVLVVAHCNNKLVGVRPFMPVKLCINNNIVLAAQPCDTAVDEKYRNKGVFTSMNKELLEYCKKENYSIVYNFPGYMSRRGYMNLGWTNIGELEKMFIINDIKNISRNKLLSIYKIINHIYPSPSKTNNPYIKNESNSDKYNIIISKEAKIDPPCQDLSVEKNISLFRNKSFLRWKFDDHPINDYKYVYAYNGKECSGYAIINNKCHKNINYGSIEDLVIFERDLDLFSTLIHQSILNLHHTDIIMMISPNDNEKRNILLNYFKFKSSLSIPFKKIFRSSIIVVKGLNNNISSAKNIYEYNDWDMSYAYRDR